MFELKDDAEVLFEINENKIVDYEVETYEKALKVNWTGSKGIGSFTYYVENGFLDTEYMGREFCIEFMKEIFKNTNVEYEEG